MIITHIHQDHQWTLPACLRVSHQWFHITGRVLYADMFVMGEIKQGVIEGEEFMLGADVTSTRAKKKEAREAKKEGRNVVQRTNFKQQLLGYIQTLTILAHPCPTQQARKSAIVKASKMMTGLQRVIICPETSNDTMEPLCQAILGCSILAGTKGHSFTLHELRSEGCMAEPLDLYQSTLKRFQHATLVVPATTFYMDLKGSFTYLYGRPKDLVDWTRELRSIRLIIGTSVEDMDKGTYENPVITTDISSVLNYLATFINLNPVTFEIYIFEDFEDTLDLVQLRQQLESKVDEIYERGIEESSESSAPSPVHPRPNWSADYQVFGLEDYFAVPDLYRELKEWYADQWRKELQDRQRRKQERADSDGSSTCGE